MPPPHDSSPQQAGPSSAEQRVSNLVGDRMCTTCGYNLIGQAVIREPHYHMLIVRCPECGTVASVQEYPLLGRWANRWASMAAAAWFFALVIFTVGSGAAIFGITFASSDWAANEYRSTLSNRYWQWWQANQSQAAVAGTARVPGSSYKEWWAQQDHDALIAELGGWVGAVEWEALFATCWLVIVAFVFGCCWAVALMGRTRTGLLLYSVAVMGVAIAFCSIPINLWFSESQSWAGGIAERSIGFVYLLCSLALAWVMLIVGMMVGRPLVRRLLCVLLPPRLCSALAIVWTADGLKPPRMK